VTVTPSGNSEIVTVSGGGFGKAPAGAASAAGCKATGSDYADNALVFQDTGSDGTTWSAGADGNCIGLHILSYTDNQVSYEFGSFYGSETKYTVQNGDSITVTVNDLQHTEEFTGG
jgi:hypothetical protein